MEKRISTKFANGCHKNDRHSKRNWNGPWLNSAHTLQTLQASVRQEAQLAAQHSAVSSKKTVTRELTRAKMVVELMRTQHDNLIVRGDLLQQLLDVVEGERQLWESRFALARDPDPGRARETYARLVPLFGSFRAFRDHLRQQLVATSGQISELDNRLQHASSVEDRRHLTSLLQVHRQREKANTRSLQRTDDASRFLERWKSEFKEQRRELPLSARIDDWVQHAWGGMKRGWTFEVFSAEDTIEVEGKQITETGIVRPGKDRQRFGYPIGRVLAVCESGQTARPAGRDTTRHVGGRRQSHAPVESGVPYYDSYRGQFGLGKNSLDHFCVSGRGLRHWCGIRGTESVEECHSAAILVLIERPLRVGDLIEVENVRGRVTTIGLRSSTVRDAKGMETLIPKQAVSSNSI